MIGYRLLLNSSIHGYLKDRCKMREARYGEDGPSGLDPRYYMDLTYRVRAGKLLDVPWTRFNAKIDWYNSSPFDCCEDMGRLPWFWEIQVRHRVWELTGIPETEWEDMPSHDRRRLYILGKAIKASRHERLPPAKWLGDDRFLIGERPLALEAVDAKVLGALVSLRAAKTEDLIQTTGLDDAVKILKKIKSKYEGLLDPYIHCPGKKGNGGYSTAIVDGRSEAPGGDLPLA